MTTSGQPNPPPHATDRADRYRLAALFLAALALRLLYIFQISHQVFFTNLLIDQASYDQWARAIAAGDWLGCAPFYQDPLYPYLLAVLYSIFGRNLPLIYILQALAASLCVLPMYGIGRRYFDRRVGLLAAGFWALYKVGFFFDGQLEKTSIGMSLLILSLWLLLVWRDRPRIRTGVAAGLSAGTLLIFRGNLIAVMPIMVAWLVIEQVRARGRTIAPAAAALLIGFCVTPCVTAARNFAVSGDFVLTTAQGGVNFFVGNQRANEWGVGYAPPWARRIPRFEQTDFETRAQVLTGEHLTGAALSRFWFHQGLEEIKADPRAALLRTGRKALLLVNWYEISDNLNYAFFADHYSWLLRLPLPAFWLAGTLGFPGLILALGRRRGGWFVLFIGVYAATLLAFYIVARYRLPIVPPLLVFAAYALVAGLEAWRKRDRPTLALLAALIIGFGALGCLHWQKRSDETTWNNMGNAYAREGRWAEAIDAYQKALAANPRLGPSLVGLGLAYQATNRFEEAARAFARAVEVDPDQAAGHYLLGVELERQGRWSEARSRYEQALRLDPSLEEAAAARERVLSHLPSP